MGPRQPTWLPRPLQGAALHAIDLLEGVTGKPGTTLISSGAGPIFGLLVHSAGVRDRTGGRLVMEQCRERMPQLRRIRADGAYRRRLVRCVRCTRR
jgi:hypothetical protein